MHGRVEGKGFVVSCLSLSLSYPPSPEPRCIREGVLERVRNSLMEDASQVRALETEYFRGGRLRFSGLEFMGREGV